jgi:hypothetical protein
MSPLTQASLLIFLLTTIVAVTLSFLSNDAVCVPLGSHLADSDTSSFYSPFFHTVHHRLCGQGSLHEKQDDWNLFYHLGGNGPWVGKANPRFGTYDKEGAPPEGCVVDQVHMV